jgi:hypothetical protein
VGECSYTLEAAAELSGWSEQFHESIDSVVLLWSSWLPGLNFSGGYFFDRRHRFSNHLIEIPEWIIAQIKEDVGKEQQNQVTQVGEKNIMGKGES